LGEPPVVGDTRLETVHQHLVAWRKTRCARRDDATHRFNAGDPGTLRDDLCFATYREAIFEVDARVPRTHDHVAFGKLGDASGLDARGHLPVGTLRDQGAKGLGYRHTGHG